MLTLLLPCSAQAEESSFRVHGSAMAARAVAGHQNVEMDFGGAAYAAVEWGPAATWGLQLEGGFIGLLANEMAPPTGLAPLDGATGGQLGAGLRVRPFAPSSSVLDLGGLWASVAGGASFTGGLVAPQVDGFVGYDAYLTRQFGIGPTVGYVHIFQSDDAPRPDDASIVLFGVHAVFDFAKKSEVLERGPRDTDGDGIFDSEDACPLEPEDRDGFEDEDGCPDPDNDGDGIPDSEDACPLEPEDRDGFEDEDGCPDPDNDGDGIVDEKDLCPNEPEVVNGYSDDDGCPDSKSVRVKGDKIELDEKIHFWTNSSTIRAMSYPVLTKLAMFLKQHPQYVHVSIEGHADSRGPAELNQTLSALRAAAVKDFLIKRGISKDRLSSQGFGESQPLVEGENEHSWFMNRRVEFVVTREKEVVVTENHAPGTPDKQEEPMEPIAEPPLQEEDSEDEEAESTAPSAPRGQSEELEVKEPAPKGANEGSSPKE